MASVVKVVISNMAHHGWFEVGTAYAAASVPFGSVAPT
jgi:hypothetical protein